MKIKKLTEAAVLFEDAEEVSADASTAEIKDAIEDTIDGISAEQAKEVAVETEKTADNIGADSIIINDDDWKDAETSNKLTRALDKSYRAALRYLAKKEEGEFDSNVLVEGLPGAGKTAIVKSWCASHGLTMVEINATDSKLDAAINGMPLRDATQPDSNEIAYAYAVGKLGPLLNDLHPELEGKCVLFVDELNRQKTPQLRRPLMNLFCGKTNADKTLDFRKNLLFSVVCINPFGGEFHDSGVGELVPAERNRFLTKIKLDSTPEDSLNYFNSWKTGKLLKLGIISPNSTASKNHNGFVGPTRKLSPQELEDAKSIIKRHALATYILSHPKFNFDTRDDATTIYNEQADYLTGRALTNGIANSDGDKKEFMEWVDDGSGFTTDKVQMFHEILDTYIMDEKELFNSYKLFADPANKAQDVNISAQDKEVEEDDFDEDDAELFNNIMNTGATSGASSSPAATERAILDIIDQW